MWTYKGQIFNLDDIGSAVGFVYLITNISTNRKYIGKKLFTKASTRQVKGKKKKIRVKSDWESYYGSNEELQSDVKTLGPDFFIREILHLCFSKSECSYWESYEIFVSESLIRSEYYNSWISCRINKTNLRSIHKK